MTEPRKIIMPVDEDGAVRQMEVEAFRQIADGIKGLNTDMRDVRERLIRIESNQLDRTVQEHTARIVALETDKNRRDGAMGFGGWLLKSPLVGWLVTAGVMAWALLKDRTG